MERLMRLLGYEPIQNKKLTEFQVFILRTLKEMTIREVAYLAQVPLTTVSRWASGETSPFPNMQPHIISHLMPEILRREDETHKRLFGARKAR